MAREEICPASTIETAIVTSVQDIEDLLRDDPENEQLLFLYANVLFRQGSLTRALHAYSRLLARESYSPEVLCNSGICLRMMGRLDEARMSFKKAILMKPHLYLAHLNLAKTELLRGDTSAAQSAADRLLDLNPSYGEGLLLRGDLALSAGMLDLAQAHFEQLLGYEPSSQPALRRYSEVMFLRGSHAYKQGELVEASRLWASAISYSISCFHDNPNVAIPAARLVEEYTRRGELANELAVFTSALVTGTTDYYNLFLHFFFSVGLIPEVFEEKTNLGEAESKWRQSLDERGDHGYAHFRIAVCKAYSGELRAALEEVRLCQDKLPPKKQTSLKLPDFVRFIHEVEDLVTDHLHQMEGHSIADEWADCGFDNEFQVRAWGRIGFLPDEAREWRENGFSPRSAHDFRRQGFSPAQGALWLEAGIRNGIQARKWMRAGVVPEVAAPWAAAFGERTDAAIQAVHAGFASPDVALPWAAAFLSPWEAWEWFSLGFSLEEASAWRDVGFSNAHQAHTWKAKYPNPAEAAYAYTQQIANRPAPGEAPAPSAVSEEVETSGAEVMTESESSNYSEINTETTENTES